MFTENVCYAIILIYEIMLPHWIISLEGGPKRVNHSAVIIDHKIYMFGGYCMGENYDEPNPIDVHVLNTCKFNLLYILIIDWLVNIIMCWFTDSGLPKTVGYFIIFWVEDQKLTFECQSLSCRITSLFFGIMCYEVIDYFWLYTYWLLYLLYSILDWRSRLAFT